MRSLFFVRIFANCAAPLHLRIFRYKVGKPAGERCSPLHFVAMVCYAAKSLRSLRGCFAKLDSISGAGLCFDFCFVIEEHLVFFFFLSAPLGRLAPIEALPQALLGALPPDPHNGFHPLTLTRGVPLDLLLASLGGSFTLHWLLSLFSYVIPHSSFLTPHSSLSSAFHCILYLCPCSCLFCHFILRFCAILLLFLAVLTLKTSSLAPFLFKLYFLYLSNENLQNRKV